MRIVLDPRDELSLNGQILCTVRTDPGWAPLFPTAGGLIVERGSTLSHSAVVAREFGIPTIVGVPNVTRTLADGEHVRIDGEAGTVERARVDDPVREVGAVERAPVDDDVREAGAVERAPVDDDAEATAEGSVRARVLEVVAEMAPVRPDEISSDSRLSVDLAYDSLTLIELTTALEHEFDRSVPSEEAAADVETVGDVQEIVLEMLAAPPLQMRTPMNPAAE